MDHGQVPIFRSPPQAARFVAMHAKAGSSCSLEIFMAREPSRTSCESRPQLARLAQVRQRVRQQEHAGRVSRPRSLALGRFGMSSSFTLVKPSPRATSPSASGCLLNSTRGRSVSPTFRRRRTGQRHSLQQVAEHAVERRALAGERLAELSDHMVADASATATTWGPPAPLAPVQLRRDSPRV